METIEQTAQKKLDKARDDIQNGRLKCSECGAVAVTMVASVYYEKVGINPLCQSHAPAGKWTKDEQPCPSPSVNTSTAASANVP